MPKMNATVTIEVKRDGDRLLQIIRIVPDSPTHIRYVTHERYKIARKFEDFISQQYIGDGEKIRFETQSKFKNSTTIKYKIYDLAMEVPSGKKSYRIEGEYPKFDCCSLCQRYVPSKRGKARCSWYKIFLDKEKKSCIDFLELD
jgi:hypothetical protein